jgi:NADH:ubiquinone oxidoreductase subunit 3 (subunit A)
MSPIGVFPFMAIGLSELFILFVFAILLVYPWAKILEKAGKSKLLALLVFIPFGMLILPWYLALTEWEK